MQRFLRLEQVKDVTGLSKSGIYARMAADDFPKSFPLSGRAVAWLETEVAAWQQRQVDLSEQGASRRKIGQRAA
jgi:prophage regulatory protein